MKHIEEFEKYVEITGFKNVKIGSTEDFLEQRAKTVRSVVAIQFFDARLIATWEHLYFAVLNALTAFKNGVNISKSLAMEILLFASAERQIRKATKLVGIEPSTSEIAVVLVDNQRGNLKSVCSEISTRVNGRHADSVLDLSPNKVEMVKKAFEISDLELETAARKDSLRKALVNLVIERTALLSTQI